ncbi:hypothetical protein Acor_55160 [Acrocarpospora corrugata]|uniref:CHAT domain-containing protein n=1 Tax=Acrocarpospora corrugata TaxID=35763 RepID=A0A5M3W5C2_9ACTN|nr:CHAT domain-containing protein [Acrocarpospora corrugata]GES03450.1 hypothetical protein Acor_55160 [Acrocarpospora corrugata]
MSENLDRLRPAFTMKAQDALDEAARRRDPGLPMDTRDVLIALMRVDTAGEWERLALDFGGIDTVVAADIPDPDPSAAGLWAGAPVTRTCTRAIKAAVALATEAEMVPAPTGALALCVLGEPDTAAARALTGNAPATYSGLIELAQVALLGGTWHDIHAVLLASFAAVSAHQDTGHDEDLERHALMETLATRHETAAWRGSQVILEADARREAEKLAELVGGRYSCDLPAAMLLATFHMHRYRRLPEGEDAWDHQQVTTWMGVINRINPGMLPPPFSALPNPRDDDVDLMTLNVTAVEHSIRFERTGDHGSLEHAIALLRRGLDVADCAQTGARAVMLSNLCGALATYAEDRKDLDAADEAVTAGRAAVRVIPPGNSDRAVAMAHLGVALQHRFGLRDDLADLEEAIRYGRASIAGEHTAHPGRSKFLASLALTLRLSYQRTTELTQLDESVQLCRQADALEADPESKALIRSNLVGSLMLRFEHVHELDDIDEAIRIGRETVALVPENHPQLAGRLLNLSVALQSRGSRGARTRNEMLTDIADSVTVARRAVSCTDEQHPTRALCLGSLAVMLQTQIFVLSSGPNPDPVHHESDITEAITALRAALKATPATHPDRAGFLNNLGLVLRRRGWPGDLDDAVRDGRAAVELTPSGHQNMAPHLSNLGSALEARFRSTQNRADLREAFTVWREAATSAAGSAPARIASAIKWGELAAAQNDPHLAAEGYQAAVALLPIVAWRGLHRSAQERLLGMWSGLASDAAVWAIRDQRPELAVELLEQGRSILWAQKLHIRTDLTRLAERDRDLAGELDRVRNALDAPRAFPELTAGTAFTVGDQERARRLAEEWDRLVAMARQLEGFANFLRPAPFEELRGASVNGPVVIVNVSAYGCDALLIDRLKVRAVPLPRLAHDEVGERARAMLTALDPDQDTPTRAMDKILTEITDWLRETVVNPVLDRLESESPRIWWCPTGKLALLPLHAAVPPHLISSYTTTLGALVPSEAKPEHRAERALVVGIPETPGQPPLPSVGEELDHIKRHLAHKHMTVSTMLQEKATRADVPQALGSYDWVHFACHGSQDSSDPGSGHIMLHDGPLSISEIAELRLARADLAYLSACETFTGDPGLPDEAIHLASAFQFAGYRHVIATLWGISDYFAPKVTDWVYEKLSPNADVPSAHAAEALHGAIARLRERYPSHPHVWAPYVHLGP